MASKGEKLGVLVLAVLGLFAVFLALATPAGASITGTQVPLYGNDWVIDQDTTVLGETISLQGEIQIPPGYTLRIRNSELAFNSSHEGEHGIYVDANSTHSAGIELDDCSIKSDYGPFGWFFEINGKCTIKNNARLYDVWNGLQIYELSDVDIDDMELHAIGSYGIFVQYADPTIKNSEINLKVQVSWTGWGIRLMGSSSDLCAPTLDNLVVKVFSIDNYDYSGSTKYSNFYLRGIEMDYAQFDTFQNIDIHFEATVDGNIDYTGTAYARINFDIRAIALYGGTQITSFKNVVISQSNYFADVDSKNAANGMLYMYNRFFGLYNQIGSDGVTPNPLTGLEMHDQKMDYNGNNVFNTYYPYYYGRAIRWYPSSGASILPTMTFDGLIIDGLEVERMFDMNNYWNIEIINSEFTECFIDDYFGYLSYFANTVKFDDNLIANCSMRSNYYFYLYRCSGEQTFSNNNISGNKIYRFARMYYNAAIVRFEDNLFSNNGMSTTGSADYMFQVYQSRGEVYFDRNDFLNNSYRYMFYIYYNYEDVIMRNNEFAGNDGSNYAWYTYYIQSDIVFRDNWVYNNTLAGGFYMRSQRGELSIEENVVDGNMMSQPFVFLWGQEYSGGYEIIDNDFLNNNVPMKMFDMYGMGQQGVLPFTFERNYFNNNTGSTATNNGLLWFFKLKQGFSIRNNVWENNSANCIVNYLVYSTYGGKPKHEYYVEGNTFINNTGKGIAFLEIDNCEITIRGNKGWDNMDYPVFLDTTKFYINDYSNPGHYTYSMYGSMQGPDMLRVESNNFSYNPGGGLWLRTSCYDPGYTYYDAGNPNQEIVVKKNILRGNGPDGWSLALANIYRKPSVKNNVLDNASMGEFWGLIGNDPRATEFDVSIRDVVIDGGPNGMTAYGFENIDAEFYDCTITNFKKAFYAKDCEVNIWWSAVPEASGKTEGKGRINVWNHLEMEVTWANVTGVDSGNGVKYAVVAMRGANGKYFGALITDVNGKLEPMIVNPWVSFDGVMDAWSPFQTTILANEISTLHDMHVIGEFVAPEVMTLTHIDWSPPQVHISNPQEGTLVNTVDVLTEGFLFEIGSNVSIFEGHTDVMAEDEWEPITEGVIWQHLFKGLIEQGEHNMSVRALDIAGNWNTSTITIIVDLVIPELEVLLEFLDATPIPYNETMGGYFVHNKEVAINGTYLDNYADERDIIIRINGVPEPIFTTQLGKIYKRVKLDQGINTLIIDATDTAGNRHTERLYVSLDSYAPTMYIYSPLQGDKTANETLLVTGLTEPNTRLDFIVQASAGTREYTSISGDDGNFEFVVDLFENVQKVLVTATDSAGNPTQLFRDITLDTTPPDFVVNQPDKIRMITSLTRFTVIGTMTREPDADVFINGQQVPNPGVFQREIILQEGDNIVEIRAVDKVGNENIKYVTIVRDTVKPFMEVTSPTGDFLLTRETTVPFTGTISGAMGVTIEHKSIPLPTSLVGPNDDWETGGEWMLDLLLGPQDLDQTVVVTAFDEAGNKVIVNIQIVLDIVNPSLHVDKIDLNDDGIADTEVDVALIPLNGTTDANIQTVTVQGVEFQVIDGEFDILWSLAAGLNIINVVVTDEAGNEATFEVEITYNWEAPPTVPGPKAEDGGLSSIYGIALLIAAITIVATAFLVTRQRTHRRW